MSVKQKFVESQSVRGALSKRIGQLDVEGARAFSRYILSGDREGMIPCWGSLAQRFEEAFAEDHARIALLDALVVQQDRRALYLFLEMSKERPAVLKALCARMKELPPSVQRILVALPQAEGWISSVIDQLEPSARALWRAGEAAWRIERELFEGRINELMSFKYFVPDLIDPREEYRLAQGKEEK